MNQLLYQLRYALPLWLVCLLTNWWPVNRYSIRFRGFLASFFMKKCGRNFTLGSHVTLLNVDRLEVGDNVYIAHGAWLNCQGQLVIEDEVMIGPYVTISTAQHVFKDGSARFGGCILRPVVIGRGSWLAAHVSVKCGVTIGKGNVIAANACVVNDTSDHVIVGGVPAKPIGPVVDGEAEKVGR